MSRIIKTIAQSDLSEEFVNKLRCERTAALICRLCATLRKTDCFVSIRDPNLNLCVKLARCCQFRLPENDRLPENVCVDCVHVLNECWTFAEKVRVAQESLNALYAVNEESEGEQEVQQINKEIANTSANTITNRSVECFENPSKIKQEVFAQIPIEELDTNFEIDDNELDAEDDEDDADEDDSSPDMDPDYLPTEEADILESLDDEMTELIDGAPDSKIEIIDTWKEYPWTCTICTGIFTSVIELRNHVTLNHNKTEADYLCADCSKVYTKYYLFLNHVRTHRSQLKMYCDICSEFLDVPKAVSSHRDKHQCGDLVSLCTSCCKAFKNSSAMVTHLRSHSVQKKFQCELCDKSFGSKPNLRAHQKIHMGLKEFVCDQCGKGFVQKANLDEHLITHVDATPYECNECGRIYKMNCCEMFSIPSQANIKDQDAFLAKGRNEIVVQPSTSSQPLFTEDASKISVAEVMTSQFTSIMSELIKIQKLIIGKKEIIWSLPVTSADKLDELNTKCKNIDMTSFFSKFKNSGIEAIFCRNLLINYNWTGSQGKNKFSEFKNLHNTLYNAFKSEKIVTFKDYEDYMKTCIKKIHNNAHAEKSRKKRKISPEELVH